MLLDIVAYYCLICHIVPYYSILLHIVIPSLTHVTSSPSMGPITPNQLTPPPWDPMLLSMPKRYLLNTLLDEIVADSDSRTVGEQYRSQLSDIWQQEGGRL